MLKIENYSYKHSFGELYALKNINISLKAGEAILMTGKSGSGKSTLLSAVSGLIPHYYSGKSSGSIRINGVNPANITLSEMGQLVGLMLQNAEVQFLAPTVEEEIFLTLKCRIDNEDECRKLASAQVAKFKLNHIRNASVLQLSEGQKQKVVLAALTALKPKLILLDEPTANLDPASTKELAEILSTLKKEGMSFLIADHRLSWLNGICEQAAVINGGEIAWLGNFGELTAVYEQFGLRSPIKQLEKTLPIYAGTDGIVVNELSFSYNSEKQILDKINCAIPKGRVTALSGASGRGKTTFGRLLAGLQKEQSGISFDGQLVDKAARQKLVRIVLQNSDHQLYMDKVVSELALAMTLDPNSRTAEVFEVLKQFGLDKLAERHPQSLSGGEKQRLVVAVGAATSPTLLILDEPTSGLDGDNLKLIAEHIKKLAASGYAVLVITHDIELVKLCADYKIVL